MNFIHKTHSPSKVILLQKVDDQFRDFLWEDWDFKTRSWSTLKGKPEISVSKRDLYWCFIMKSLFTWRFWLGKKSSKAYWNPIQKKTWMTWNNLSMYSAKVLLPFILIYIYLICPNQAVNFKCLQTPSPYFKSKICKWHNTFHQC